MVTNSYRLREFMHLHNLIRVLLFDIHVPHSINMQPRVHVFDTTSPPPCFGFVWFGLSCFSSAEVTFSHFPWHSTRVLNERLQRLPTSILGPSSDSASPIASPIRNKCSGASNQSRPEGPTRTHDDNLGSSSPQLASCCCPGNSSQAVP